MDQPLRIGIIGDFDTNRPSQMATNEALNHTAKDLSIALDMAWLPTQQLENEFNEMEVPELWSCLITASSSPRSFFRSFLQPHVHLIL